VAGMNAEHIVLIGYVVALLLLWVIISEVAT
jgi:hypothetical protein